ncbi:hypothetical protein AB0A91_29270 [Streptomyces sp. NPDC042207]|uniref:hypothetical protein n=1 Tax=Streptomyces sp. NPDC042207 TaxID=3154331 RepID=UPI0033C15C37
MPRQVDQLPPDITSLARRVRDLERTVTELRAARRLTHASIDGGALQVRDTDGNLRALLGVQADGTVGLVSRGGPAPGAPTEPAVTPSIGGLRIVWDGALADGPLPTDFDHVAVHMSTVSGFSPSAATFVGTIIRSGDGGMLPVTPLPYQAHYVRLVAVNTSGVGGSPSVETTATPQQVDGPDLKAGSVAAATIEAGAVTADKLEAVLQLVTRLVAGNPNAARVELNENGLRVYNSSGQLVSHFDAVDGSAELNSVIIRGALSMGGNALYYGGTPARGSLRMSIAASAGTDPFGNEYGSGLTLYNGDGSWASIDTGTAATLYLSPPAVAGTDWIEGKVSTTLGASQRPGVSMASPVAIRSGAKRASLDLYGGGPTTNDTSLLAGVDRASFSGSMDVAGPLTAANIQSGRVNVTPVANQWTDNISVSFPRAFAIRPEVTVTPSSSAPAAGGTTSLAWATASVTTTGFVLRVLRGSATAMEFSWTAIST